MLAYKGVAVGMRIGGTFTQLSPHLSRISSWISTVSNSWLLLGEILEREKASGPM